MGPLVAIGGSIVSPEQTIRLTELRRDGASFRLVE